MQASPSPSPLPSRPLRSGVYRPCPPAARVHAPPRAPTLLILPGFCNDALDYTAAPSTGEAALADVLQSRGWTTAVPAISRGDWLKVASCAFDPDYWRGTACVSRAYGFYLDAAGEALASAASASPSGTVVLVGHSAGGWLGRALIGRNPALRALTAGLVSLGTPHAPPASGDGARCPTGGALAAVCDAWPGAYFAGEGGLGYVAVAGLAVRGDAAAPRGAAARSAASAYATVSGGPGHGVIGDGVVPRVVAGLSGAVNLALPGVFHAQARPGGRGRGGRAAAARRARGSGGGGGWWPLSDSSDGEEAASPPPSPPPLASRLPWYGSEGVVDAWLGALVGQLR